MARGYLNNVNATNLKFIENPHIPDSRKVYKTGDLGRFREDGKIEFLGRVDAQMKVRGFRIELGEIEKVVFRFEGIKECAVVAKEMNNNLKRLICCYSGDVSINRADLKNFISLELPDYMVPSEFIELDKLPRLPNGKIDKLKVLDVEPQVEIQGDDTPNNEIEQLIYNVWKEVLNIEILGIHDNFFEIGGDSISSIRIISKAKNVGLNMHANQIFKYQSISELARVVELSQKENNRTSEDIIGESLLSPIQMWFFQNFKNKPHYWNLACNIRLQKSVPERQILKALGALVSRHSALRQTFENVDGSWISKYVAYHEEDFLVKVKEHDYTNEIKQIQEETRLNQGPLFKLILKQSESTDAYNSIVFMAHHLIIDVVSWSIIIDEFAADLEKLDASEEIQLMPGSTQFKDWVEYINDPERISEYQGELRYWRNQIGSAARNPEVPLREKNVLTETISIERSTTAKLVKDALVAYNLKVHELIMCIYTITIGDFMKTDEVIVWTEGHGRRKDLDYSESVGWLTSYYPIRFNLEDALDKTLISLKENLRSIPNEGIGYGFLRYIQKEDRLAFPEKFSFNFNGIREKFSNAVIQDMEFLYEGVRAEESEVSQLIDLNCQIDNDHLVCRFRFDGAEMNNSEINTFTSIFNKKLDSTIEHCIQADAQFTPSDFPDADLSDDDLNAILGQV